ncbi:MAG: hypothetical protein J6I98_05305 [Clostridia bacterium]|nr:hypothetical protein [Clostridia bacterium]
MKKYVKPELFYERYELSQHIANCSWELNLEQGTCGYIGDETSDWPDTVIISSEISGCLGMEANEDFCYTAGNEGHNTFMS